MTHKIRTFSNICNSKCHSCEQAATRKSGDAARDLNVHVLSAKNHGSLTFPQKTFLGILFASPWSAVDIYHSLLTSVHFDSPALMSCNLRLSALFFCLHTLSLFIVDFFFLTRVFGGAASNSDFFPSFFFPMNDLANRTSTGARFSDETYYHSIMQ